MKRFEILEHTAEVGIRAYGRDLGELFANAGLGMLSLIADLKSVQPKQSLQVSARAKTLPDLFFNWLEELLFQFSTKYFLCARFDIHAINERQVSATGWGEPLDLTRHPVYREVKAITYQDLKVERRGTTWVAEVIVDI